MSLNLKPDFLYPNILIVGTSGTGKSTSLRNLDPETTAIGNIERKPLPFKESKNFKYHEYLKDYSDVPTWFFNIGMNNAIEVAVLESFTDYSSELYRQCRQTQKGWDVINAYNKSVYEILQNTKTYKGKFIVFLARDEVISITLPEGGNQSQRKVKVHGKDIDAVESFFTICLYTEAVKGMNGKLEYKFVTNGDGVNTAKTPMGMFSELKVDNDLNEVLKKVKEYYD